MSFTAGTEVMESAQIEQELRLRLQKLTLESKVRLLTGADFWSLHPEPKIGLRRLVVSDGPAGVRGESLDERNPSANVPSPTALAATWDVARLEVIGKLIASECRRKGVDVLLAPTVNLHRTPYGGRHFECYSEDPYLTAQIGAAYVRGVQSEGVGATVKHFVANDSETERFTYDAEIGERALRELYLAPFETIVREAKAWAVMAAYNSVAGKTMTESPMLREILKGEWGFDGLVMSDWFAGRSLDAAEEGLLDLVMPGPHGPWGEALVEAVRNGSVPELAVDEKALRILRVAARVGALERIAPVAQARIVDDAEIASTLRATASEGMVLLHNSKGTLPLVKSDLRAVAVVGPNAATARTLGGGSATVAPPYVVSPLDGIRNALDAVVRIEHRPGGAVTSRVPNARIEQLTAPDGTRNAVEVRFMDRDNHLLASEVRHATHLMWQDTAAGAPLTDVDSIEFTAVYEAAESGTYQIGGSGIGRFILELDGVEAFSEMVSLPSGADMVEVLARPPQALATVDLSEGQRVSLKLRVELTAGDFSFGDDDLPVMPVIQINAGRITDVDAEIEAAVEAARNADVAIVVVGTTDEVESEGFDRTSLSLPGRQDELVRRVAGVNSQTVVVVNAGAPVLLPWADDVAAVLLAWFPGQEAGNAIADVLFGAVEPCGRLPVSWPANEEGHPACTPENGVLRYSEGLHIGYRGYEREGRIPRYPFGFGLGYTEWAYDEMSVDERCAYVRVRNAGARAGREVVQVYASRPDGQVERPPRWLVGFAVVDAAAGETKEVAVQLAPRAFEHWDTDAGRWSVEPGTFVLHAGRSVADLRLKADLSVLLP
ncbi:beta-glucosidase family protein [Hoyosella altamirensis]|uniref:Beta-glucosidase n=1 Tax=Hoyosella altamirensis TaxID=616997 RepID=A0A839RRN4_9ACTN|nr:glycoside hydrolase family 3 C-terminal domain-containing protein [Hoyosella altamirensis]MBB3038764.1 beta-glucosidase [Hoyosella altamirensis]